MPTKHKKVTGGKKMVNRKKGMGFADDFDKFLKDTKLVSNVGAVALPFLGGLVGSLADPFVGPVGTVMGGIAGQSANDWIKSKGYGKHHQKAYGYLGGVPLKINKGSRFPKEEVGKVAGGGRRVRGHGIGLTAVFGTVSSDRGMPCF